MWRAFTQRREKGIKKQRKVSSQVEAGLQTSNEGADGIGEQIRDDELIIPGKKRPEITAEEVPFQGTPSDPMVSSGDDIPATVPQGWFSRNRENFLLGLLVLYVLLLGLGTAGELFEVEWILNLPIFR